MNRTFLIIGPHFPHFETKDWFVWFHVKLVPVLASFSAVMLENATSNMNCSNYHVVGVVSYKQAALQCTKVQYYC